MDLKNFYKQYIKRVMDILCSFLFLVLFWWLLVLVAFLVKLGRCYKSAYTLVHALI